MTVQDVFEKIPQKVQENPDIFQGVEGTFRFVIHTATGDETYCVQFPSGKVEKNCGQGDVVVEVKEGEFLSLVSGDLNPVTAYMMGKIRVSGRMDLAMKMAGILKALS